MNALVVTTIVTPMPPAQTPLEVSTAPATLDTLAVALMAHAWTLMSALMELTRVMQMQTAQTQLETIHVNASQDILGMAYSVKVSTVV